jgi:hypothetical protein
MLLLCCQHALYLLKDTQVRVSPRQAGRVDVRVAQAPRVVQHLQRERDTDVCNG